jgi:preprotein translocase subunit SecG
MQTVLIVILLIVTLAMIGVILLQKSEGGTGLTGGSSMGGMMSSRAAANLLNRTTSILATIFMILCLVLAIMSGRTMAPKSIFDTDTPAKAEQTTEAVEKDEAPVST